MCGWCLWYLARWEQGRGEHTSQVEVKGPGQNFLLDTHLHYGPVPTVASEMA